MDYTKRSFEILDKLLERNAKREWQDAGKNDVLLDELDEELWNSTIDNLMIYSDHITFAFKDSIELASFFT